MNKTNSISEQPVNDRLDITLMDGRTLSCVLKSEQPKEIMVAQLWQSINRRQWKSCMVYQWLAIEWM